MNFTLIGLLKRLINLIIRLTRLIITGGANILANLIFELYSGFIEAITKKEVLP